MGNAAHTIATLFGIGYCPKASGTAGSLAVMPFALAVAYLGGFWALLAWTITLYVIGTATTKEVLKHSVDKDPSFVVIDEACGQSLALLPLAAGIDKGAIYWPLIIAAFALFRLFDIIKPWPACYFDRKVHSAHGVMLDDVAAAIYAIAALYTAAVIAVITFPPT